MKRYHIFLIGFLLPVVLLSLPVHSQTTSDAAKRWFNTGLTENDMDKKIKAFQNAVDADPKFVQALYYLGLAHKARKDFAKAELYLNRAKDASPSLQKKGDRFAIYYELAKVHLRVGNATLAEQLLQESIKLDVKDELAGKAYFELGRLLFNQGRYPEALNILKTGQELNSAQKEFFKNLITLSENASRSEQLYTQAEQHLSAGNLKGAKKAYEQINLETPGFKDVEAKIVKVDSLIKKQLILATLDELYWQAEGYIAAGNFTMAIASYESILEKSRSFKDVQQKLDDARKKLQDQQLAAMLNKNYQEGLSAYERQDWTRAIAAFEKVSEVDPSYLDTRKILADSRKRVAPDSLQTLVFRYYKFGLEAMEKDDFDEALRTFEQVEKLNPGYRNVASLIAVLKQATIPEKNSNPYEEESTSATETLLSEAELDSLYTEALILLDNKAWIKAIVHLEKLRLIKKDYRDVESLLIQARANLVQDDMLQISEPADKSDTNLALIGGGILAIIFLPLLGFVLLSPTARARLYLLRGNYTAAALIYENALLKNPGKLKLYPKLAHLYLLDGRTDENAIKIFRTVLKLNLDTNERTEMNSIVGNYLKAGKVEEDDAISALENALRAEQQKQAKPGE